MRIGFLLLESALKNVPYTGRYDVVCPARTAYDLKKVFPELELTIVPDAGHSAREEPTNKLLVEVSSFNLARFISDCSSRYRQAADKFKDL